jgi:CDP-glycerol glycerophosphotransferase
VINDKNTKIPGNPKRVKKNTLAHYKEMATSKYWVMNTRQDARYFKRNGQIFLSTWHGTPLKRLGFDMENIHLKNPKTKDAYLRDSSDWDYFVSQNPFSTETLARAFGYDGVMLETGYPRNDILYNADEDKVNQIKSDLNIPAGKKVILYAPTWRDIETHKLEDEEYGLELDLNLLKESLGDEYVILIRTHYLISNNLNLDDFGDFAINVSGYDDIAELYLVSDLLITDYSSVFFDFANLRRPVLFYTYDLEEYESELRGFYIDIKTEVPGPLLMTSEEVLEAIQNIDEITEEYREKYDEFYDRFCSIDDGNASKRIVEIVWDKHPQD